MADYKCNGCDKPVTHAECVEFHEHAHDPDWCECYCVRCSRLCECGHVKCWHHPGWAYGLECFVCDVCACPEFSSKRDSVDLTALQK